MDPQSLLSRCVVMMDDVGTFINLAVDLLIRDADSASVYLMNVWRACAGLEVKRVIIMVAEDNPRGREFWKRSGWEELPEQSVWELTFDNSCPTGRTRT